MPLPQWEGIREFVAVAEQGSFTGAARWLKTSTAHISRQVQALEQRLGTVLLHRTTRKVSLTESGQQFWQQCRPLLDALAEAERALGQWQATPTGRLRITAPMSYGERHLAPLLNNFAARHPQLQLHYWLTNQTLDLVEQGYDLAIRVGPLQDSRLIAKRLASRRLFTCASPQYLASFGRPLTPSQLRQHHCLAGTLDHWRFAGDEVVAITPRLRANSGPALLDAALKGLGVAQLPDYYVAPMLQSGELEAVLKDYQPQDEGIWALYSHSLRASPKIRLLIDYLSERLVLP
ncbi:transcriptional regulator [Bacterioplanes sanyensis]|nr:transcriptional regulator [Bacterioplanes sanyensis]